MVAVAVAGSWRQFPFGNVRLRDGILIGVLSPLGVIGGVILSNAVSERVLELSFAALLSLVAVRLIARALRPPPVEPRHAGS